MLGSQVCAVYSSLFADFKSFLPPSRENTRYLHAYSIGFPNHFLSALILRFAGSDFQTENYDHTRNKKKLAFLNFFAEETFLSPIPLRAQIVFFTEISSFANHKVFRIFNKNC